MADLKITIDNTDFVETARAAERLEREIKTLEKAVKSGNLTQGQANIGKAQAKARYDQLTDSLRKATAAQTQFGSATQKSTRRIGQSQVLIQQAGYQIGDFIVQVQSGTNAFVALGQQATQVAGTLTLLGGKYVAIGAALSVVIPLATAYLAAQSRIKEGAKDTTTQLEKLEQTYRDIKDSASGLELDLAELAQQFGDNAAKVRDYRIALTELRLGQAESRLGEELVVANEAIARLTETTGDALGKNMREFADTVGLAHDQAVMLQEELNRFTNLPIEQQGGKFLDIYRLLVDMEVPLNKIPDYLQQALIEAGATLVEMERLRAATESAESAAKGFANVDMRSGVASAAAAAETLARQFGIAYTHAYNLARLGGSSGASLGFSGVSGTLDSPFNRGKIGSFGAGGSVFGGSVRDLPKPIKVPSSGSSGGGSKSAQESYLSQLMREAEQKRKLVGLSEEETRRQEIIFELEKRKQPIDQEKINKIIQLEEETRKLIETEEQRLNLIDTMKDNIESAFMSIADGSESVVDAFRNMLRNIILAIFEQQVAKPAANIIGNFIGSLFQAKGGAWSNGVQMFANGGVVNGATAFGYSGGIGIMGEAGPEAIMPLKRGPNGKLGVEASGQSLVINQSFNFSANGDDSVKRIIRGELPRITEATKAAVVDSKRRGGTYGRSF